MIVKQKAMWLSVEDDGKLSLWDEAGEGRAEVFIEVTPFSIGMSWISVVPDNTAPETIAQLAIYEGLVPD